MVVRTNGQTRKPDDAWISKVDKRRHDSLTMKLGSCMKLRNAANERALGGNGTDGGPVLSNEALQRKGCRRSESTQTFDGDGGRLRCRSISKGFNNIVRYIY